MIRADKIEGMFRNLDGYLTILREQSRQSEAEILDDAVQLGSAKYYLQVAVECCIDIANHIIAHQNWRAPSTYAEGFVILVEQGVLGSEFLDTARHMVGMRNRLVHLYWEIDAETVYQVLQNDLGDFDRFKMAIYAYLDRSGLLPDSGESAQ